MTKQKDYFLESEGDKWFERNLSVIENKMLPHEDRIMSELLRLPPIRTYT